MDGAGGRLPRPTWPLAEPGKDFIRSSGLVRARHRGGIGDWAGEELFGDGKHALRFPDHLGHLPFGSAGAQGSLKCLFRRFHSEGTVARFDVGFRFSPAEPATRTKISLLPLIRQVLALNVNVRSLQDHKQRAIRLVDAGESLARHYLLATTHHKHASRSEPPPSWWFSAGSPALVIEHDGQVTLPPHTRRVMEVAAAGASLSHARLQIDQQPCSSWFINVERGDPDAVRRLRMHLVRLHSERECLKRVILHLKDGDKLDLTRDSSSSRAVDLYLRDKLNLIQRPRYLGIDQSAMLRVAREALGVAFEGENASLELPHRQISVRVEDYVRQAQNTATVINNIRGNVMNTIIQMGNLSVTGDFNLVTATNIENSFNKAADSDVNAELRESLKSLARQVAELVKKLPPDDAEQVSKDLATLTTEAVSKKPRKEWYDLSAKGLLDAAKTVASMSAPITTAVKAVLALLAP